MTDTPAAAPYRFVDFLRDEWRFLTFRPTSAALPQSWGRAVTYGLIVTWLAGIGRYWDHPDPALLQLVGLGSVIYVFVLAPILAFFAVVIGARNAEFPQTLLFVVMTSPPALLYAIPVERFLSPDAAIGANLWFLLVVALWRVALFARFLRCVGRLRWIWVIVTTLAPLCLIVNLLALLNLEQAVFEIMAGIAREPTARDASYAVVIGLMLISWLLAPALLIALIIGGVHASNGDRTVVPESRETPDANEGDSDGASPAV